VHRFACTRCGKCCNRPPEIELSEATALADIFVFRLMFLLYRLPRGLNDFRRQRPGLANAAEQFVERKRMLVSFAARKRPVRTRHGGRIVDENEYLIISALALDTRQGTCSALEGGRCAIYPRRPFACRTVPLHYTGVEAGAASDLAEFVATPGYACDTSENAPVAIEGSRIVDPTMRNARVEALAAAEQDGPWKQAILRRVKAADGTPGLPTLQQIEANARYGAMTTSMRAAWQIAADAGLMTADECRALVRAQFELIQRELTIRRSAADTRQTLLEMQMEYGGRPKA
jgi:Fe-S-cluster containining protein